VRAVRTDRVVASSTGGNCGIAPASHGTITDTGYNLEWSGTGHTDTCGFGGTGDVTGTDPQLGALASNGGPTQTMALASTSPAIDKIPTSSGLCPAADQRGAVRPDNGGASCDIGAYEFGGTLVTPTATPNPTNTPTPTPARSSRVLLNIRSSRSRSRYQSAAFSVAGAWQMHAAFNCSSVKTHDFHLTVHKSGGSHATVHDVHVHVRAGNRTNRYLKGGSLYLLVQSPCRWQIKVTGTPPRS
jgi:hypothetical protein